MDEEFFKARLSYLTKYEVFYRDYLNSMFSNASEGKKNSVEGIKELIEKDGS